MSEGDKQELSAARAVTGSAPPPLLQAMGGPLGIAESAAPPVAFVVAITAGAEIATAAYIAVGLAIVLAVARIARRQTIQFALTGVIGVAISAYIASKTGEARNFFLKDFVINAGYLVVILGSVIARRPFVGYVVSGFAGDGGSPWRKDPVRMRVYRNASLMWAGLFALRLLVQVPLYLADELVALGTAKIAMGLPLFGVGIWLTWLMVRGVSGTPDPTVATAGRADLNVTPGAMRTGETSPHGDEAGAPAAADPQTPSS